MNREYLGKIIYDKFIFTIPIICDLCLIYGNTNKMHISKLLDGLFFIQPNYYDDLRIAISFIKQVTYLISAKKINMKVTHTIILSIFQVFDFISFKHDKNSSNTLPEVFKGFSQNFCGRQSNATNSIDKVSFESLKDFVLHILDSAVTIRIFLDLHTPARKIFKEKEFYLRYNLKLGFL